MVKDRFFNQLSSILTGSLGIVVALSITATMSFRSASHSSQVNLSSGFAIENIDASAYPVRVYYDDTTKWSPPRFDERRDERHQMVSSQIERRGISDPNVLEAMRHVPRHLFVSEGYMDHAYEDRPLPIGHSQTISQPYIVAYMTQSLGVDSTDKVLEIGTGSGYQAAVLSEITPHVYTIEIVAPLARQAIKRFDKLGYHTIRTKIGNGYNGWEKYAPYDAIIVTAAPDRIPEALLQQLKPGGDMVIPVGEVHQTQKLLRVSKTSEEDIKKETLLPVRFVPMTGKPN